MARPSSSPSFSPYLAGAIGAAFGGGVVWFWTRKRAVPVDSGPAPAQVDPNASAPGLQPATTTPAPNTGAGAGTAADAMVRAQRALASFGWYAGPQDGATNAEIVAAIRRLQASKGLPETGTLDPDTMRLIDAIPLNLASR